MKKKIITFLLASCLIGACLYGGVFLIYQSRVKAITLSHQYLKNVDDGNYSGTYNALFVQAAVTVKVKNHRFTAINLDKHIYDRGEKGRDIIDRVLNAQSTDVDTISGATNSCNVILKSIENAIDKGAN